MKPTRVKEKNRKDFPRKKSPYPLIPFYPEFLQ